MLVDALKSLLHTLDISIELPRTEGKQNVQMKLNIMNLLNEQVTLYVGYENPIEHQMEKKATSLPYIGDENFDELDSTTRTKTHNQMATCVESGTL